MKPLNVLDPNEVIDRNLVIEASAGTGKTYSIQHLYVRNLLRGAKISEILVVTFTKASTKELKERILGQLREIASGVLPDYFPPTEEALLLIKTALREFDACEIDTIHAFAKRMLSTYSFEASLFLENVHEESPLDEEKLKAVRDFLRTDLEGLSYGLAQKKILLSLKPEVIVLQEKATVPFRSFKELFDLFVQMIPQFPRNGVAESLLDLAPQFYKEAELYEIEFFGKAFEEILQNPTLEAFDRLLFSNLSVLDHFSRRKKKGEDPFWLKTLQEELTPLMQYALSKDILKKRLMLDLAPLIRERTILSGRLGFDEILLSMKTAVQLNSFRAAVQQRYRAVLIDEFQDTDPIQWSIFSTLFLKDWEGVLYLVGDPKQSIYAFRDADIYTYLLACDELGEEAKVSLSTNYRSHPHLIDALNAFFSTDEFIPLPKIGRYLPYQPVLAGRESSEDASPRFELYFGKSEEEAWLDAIALIQQKMCKGCCVLVKDKNQAKAISELFKGYHVPHFFLKRLHWEENPAIFQLKIFLKSITHPEDLHRLKALLGSPLCKLSADTLQVVSYPDIIATLKQTAFIFNSQGLYAAFDYFTKTKIHGIAPLMHCKEELQTLFKLIDMAGKKDDIEAYLDRLYLGIEKDQESDFNPKELQGEGVAISTIHMSKGLEFEHVFVLGLSSPVKKPDSIEFHPEGMTLKEVMKNPLLTGRILETEAEWMRQLYVALTRAKETLYVPVYPLKGTSILSFFLDKRFLNLEEWLETVGKEHFIACRKEPLLPDPSFSILVERVTMKLPKASSYRKKSQLIHSYTSLSAMNEEMGIEYLPQSQEDHSIHSMPRSKDVGIAIHALLEKIPYRRLKKQEEVYDWVQEALKGHFLHAWADVIAKCLHALFEMKLPIGFSLGEVSEKEMLREIDFLFLNPISEFSQDPGEEYLTGQMDALFSYRGKYYLIDWKTNWLGPDADAYTTKSLKKYMDGSNYPLQAKIYQKALKTSLETIEKRSFEEAFGGCIYLFLRGIPEGEGVIVWQP